MDLVSLSQFPVFPRHDKPTLCDCWWSGPGKWSICLFQPQLLSPSQTLGLPNLFCNPQLPGPKSPVCSLSLSPLSSIGRLDPCARNPSRTSNLGPIFFSGNGKRQNTQPRKNSGRKPLRVTQGTLGLGKWTGSLETWPQVLAAQIFALFFF